LQHNRAPFRADHVGSFLRSGPIVLARSQFASGRIDAERLRSIEDVEIEMLIKKQEEIGLALATDGEFRREFWHFDFFGMLDGVEVYELDHGIQFQGVQTKPKSIKVTGKIGFPRNHPMLGHFRFLKSKASVVPKMTIPSPNVLHFRLEPGAVATSVYSERDAIFEDLIKTYQDAVQAFYDAGCRYLQIDDTAWAYLCSEVEMQKAKARGIKTARIVEDYAWLANGVIARKPADMIVTTHICRGNFRSTWVSSGGYEPIAERLFGDVKFDGFFLEYDSDRAGGFEPLRFFPRGSQIAVLGLITSKSGTLESKDAVRRRIDEATKYVDVSQCALSPQCGFASTEEGNELTIDAQWNKMRMIVELAEEIWGR
jgi:5-methyltetrahydropteroyltriglutamate--homocysteine methyltransferase